MNIVDSSGWLAYFADEQNAKYFLPPLSDSDLLVVPSVTSLAISASKLSLEHQLPMADSIILATAQEFKAIIWTQDSDFKNIKEDKVL